jgi:hypothetical protein
MSTKAGELHDYLTDLLNASTRGDPIPLLA